MYTCMNTWNFTIVDIYRSFPKGLQCYLSLYLLPYPVLLSPTSFNSSCSIIVPCLLYITTLYLLAPIVLESAIHTTKREKQSLILSRYESLSHWCTQGQECHGSSQLFLIGSKDCSMRWNIYLTQLTGPRSCDYIGQRFQKKTQFYYSPKRTQY